MSDLPPGWEWTTLSEVGEWFGGATPSKSNSAFWTNGTIPWISPKDISSHTITKSVHCITESALTGSPVRLIPSNSVVIVVRSGILERTLPIAIVSFTTTLNQDLKALAPHPGISHKWIAHCLRAFEDGILSDCRKLGTTVASIDVSRLMRLKIPLAPLDEQHRIVTILDEHLSRLDTAESILCAATERVAQVRDQYIAAACTGYLTFTTGCFASPPAYVGVQDGELPSLPENWRWARLGEIADVVGGITKDAKRQSDVELPEIPYLRVANVQRGHLDLDRVTLIRIPGDKARKLLLQAGDVLLNEGGDRDKLGRGWIWEGQIPECIHQNHVFRARIRDNQLDPRLLAWHANTFGKGWCERNGKQSVNLASISLSKIRLLPVPVPPRKDQASLVTLIEERITELDQLAETLRRALGRCAHLRRSLLMEGIAGRLMKQDPNDEPASLLLARIKVDRTTRWKVKHARRTTKNGDPG